MAILENYQIESTIYEGNNSLVYRGRRKEDHRPIVLKLLNKAYPSPTEIGWFKQEYEVMHSLNPGRNPTQALAGVVAAYDLVIRQQQWMIVFDDFGGESLEKLKLAGQIELTDFLKLAIEIVEILSQIHRKHIIHKDINPSNIVMNPKTGQVKLIDFGISTVLSRETPTLNSPNVLQGTLAYISPEQTGRMNRAIDYRTDFYSLGVTFYELLTGQLPFPIDDPMALIHAHIAQQPVPPHMRRDAIPQVVSDIIMKLMAKNAEDRYQSGQGLKADLETCLQQQQTGRIEPFLLGQADIPDQFQISQKLYGREREIEMLLSAFDRVSAVSDESPAETEASSRAEMVLVAGYAGIGKSALLQEVYKPITRQRGYFISGKFDQFQRNIPYSSVIQAFRSLMQQLLTETEIDIANWSQKLLDALGPNGQVIIDVIPEVELIIGPQPAVPELGPAEAQNRFNLVFQNFISVFTRPEHPLVIFLDDLQWADSASLKLLDLLMTAPVSRHLLVMGAYRDNEVNEAHPLMLALANIRQAGATVSQISLSPLTLPDVMQLLADTLKSEPQSVKSLAELVLAKTGGNPFFMNEFLKALHAQELIIFDANYRQWAWNLAEIQTRRITDNVVELMAGKVSEFSDETQAVLKLAACIGNQFDLRTLTVASEKSHQEIGATLWPAMAEGLVLPLSDSYQLVVLDVEGLADEVTPEYRFAHDRVQQAVYSLIPEEEKQRIHYQIGHLLRQNSPADGLEQRIFAIVNQLNQGRALIETQPERDELARLNLMAGRKAKAAAGYQPALNYLQIGLELVGSAGWDLSYQLALELHTETTEAALLAGEFEQMSQLAETALAHASAAADKARIYEIQIRAYMAQNNPPAAIKTALQALALLGVVIPEQPTEADIGAGLMKTQAAWSEIGIEKLLDLPGMTDPEKLLAMQIISTVMPITYVAAPMLVPMLGFSMVDLSIEYGNAPASTFGYATYGLVLCGPVGDLDSGYQFGRLATKLLDRLQAKEYKARTYFYVHLFTTHWKRHLRDSLAPALEAYQSGLETGDLANSALTAMLYGYHAYVAGQELTGLIQEFARYSQAMKLFKQDFALLYNELYRHAAVSWVQGDDPEHPFYEDYYEEMLALSQATQNRSATWIIHLSRLIFNYTFQRYEQALENATQAEPYQDAGTGAITPPLFYLYDSLTRLALYPEADEAEQVRLLEKVTANQETMKNWSQHAPMNFLHKYYLVEAERARVLGEESLAREYYDKAIDLAQEHQYLNEEALAFELAGRFYLAQGQTRLARYYLRDAHYAYQQWGAQVKVKDLEKRYPRVLTPHTAGRLTIGSTTPTTSSGATASSSLDLASVLKASQAISGEIVLETLLSKLMKIIIENAGAQKGILILEHEGRRVIEAEAFIGESDESEPETHVRPRQGLPVESSQNLSLAVVNYVARTKESVVLNDAAREGRFTHDAYIVSRKPQSLLCLPLINQGELVGILYLENNLTTGAFTPDRLELLNLLSSQAAISIENAQLYTDLQVNEEKYRTLFEDSRDTIFISGPDGQILDINPAGVNLFGYSRAELLSMGVKSLYANPDDRLRFQQAIETQGQVRDFAVTFRRKDGARIDCLITGIVRRAEDGTILNYQGIIRDITAQKRAEQQRLQLTAIQRELSIAEDIQQQLLPPAKPAWPELDVVCYNMPAREMGGDLYAYYAFEAAEGSPARYAVAVGDVSGKGIPAALLMAVSLASFQAAVGQGFSPAELLTHLDKAIELYTYQTNQNCAMIYAEITPPAANNGREGSFCVSNSGCITPLIRRAGGELEWVNVGGLPLGTGLAVQFGYQEISVSIAKGDLIILISDGVIEAINSAEELFGFERFEQAVLSGPAASAEAMLAHLRAEVNSFVKEAEPHDDLTIVVIRI